MVIAEPAWLKTAGDIAGTVLLIELGFLLVVLAALMIGLAYGGWWVRHRAVPVLDEYAPKALQAMTVARTSTDKVVNGVAEFYGRRQQLQTSLRVLLFGRQAAQRSYEASRIQAAADLNLMSGPEEAQVPGPENGFTPRLRTGEGELAAHRTRRQLEAPRAARAEQNIRNGQNGANGPMSDLASDAG